MTKTLRSRIDGIYANPLPSSLTADIAWGNKPGDAAEQLADRAALVEEMRAVLLDCEAVEVRDGVVKAGFGEIDEDGRIEGERVLTARWCG